MKSLLHVVCHYFLLYNIPWFLLLNSQAIHNGGENCYKVVLLGSDFCNATKYVFFKIDGNKGKP